MVSVDSIIEATFTRDLLTVDHAETKMGLKLSSVRFPVRWGEMDALGHVNNVAYLRFFEESRILWSASLGIHLDGKGEGMILLKTSVTYKKQLTYPANIVVDLFAGEVGRTSFRLDSLLTVEGDSAPTAIGEFVIVWFDYQANKAVPVPETLRAILQGKAAQK
jgi:acyl-CoA thioester hydrolase